MELKRDMIVRGTLESVDAGMGLTLTGVIFENLEVDGTILCAPLAAARMLLHQDDQRPPLCLPHYRFLLGPHNRLTAVRPIPMERCVHEKCRRRSRSWSRSTCGAVPSVTCTCRGA